ncbi:MAG: 5-(carboxyamino)imidazole ribonucleotide synthase [Arsenophonus sp. ET-DL9-MAG3]
MKTIIVLGNGQLSRMLRQAGEPLGITVHPISIDNDKLLESIHYESSIVTTEIEHWPKTSLTCKLTCHPNFINRNLFPKLTDRLLQKRLINSLSLTTVFWKPLSNQAQWPQLFTELGDLVIVKSRIGGYDGRWQWYITPDNISTLPIEIYGQAIVEKIINFSGEISLIGARNINGECVFYPITYNFHQKFMLRASIVFPNPDKKMQMQAELMLSTIMKTLNYIGVMAMECFILNNKILINELSPRVHNSGHWTQNGASISQFELHLRAILNLPIPTPNTETISVMMNLIGITLNPAWLSLPLVHFHWYEKDVRLKRKVGHLNLCSNNCQSLSDSLNIIQKLLPNEYNDSIIWLNKKLTHFSIRRK